MLKILSYIIVLIFLNLSTFAQSRQLKDFNEYLEALTSGMNLKIVIHYEKCRLLVDSVEVPSPKVIGGMNIKAFEYFAKGSVNNDKAFISTSESILIFHPRYGYVFNYVKLRIFENNSIEILVTYLDPKTYEVAMEETFYSELSDQVDSNAVYIFSD